MLVAGVDSSTQSTKVLLCRADDGTVVGQGSAPHPDGTETDPAAWWAALAKAGEGLLDQAAAVGVAGQQHGMVILDEAGAVIRPALLWNDLRSAPAAAALIRERGGPLWWATQTGSVPTASFTVKVAGSTAASPKINLDTGTSGHIWSFENLNSSANDPLQISWDGFRGIFYDMLGVGFNVRPTGSSSLELNVGGVSAGGGLVAGIHLKNNSTAAGAMLTLGTNFTNTTGGTCVVIYDTVAAVYKNALSAANRAGSPLLKLVEAGGQVTALGTNTLASAAGLVWDAIDMQAATLTMSGSTNVTTATGLNLVDIKQPTITSGSAITVSHAATMRIAGAPVAAGSTTITKGYSLWIDAGLPRIDSSEANGTVATVLGSLGPAGANTTVQEWLLLNINGNDRRIPCF